MTEGKRLRRRRPAMWEFLAGLVLVGVLGFVLLLQFARGRETICRRTCISNLRQLGLVMALYANENQDRLPPLDDRPGNLMFEGSVVVPEFLSEVDVLGCPSDPAFDPTSSFRLKTATEPHHGDVKVNEPHADCMDTTSYQYVGAQIITDTHLHAYEFAVHHPLPECTDLGVPNKLPEYLYGTSIQVRRHHADEVWALAEDGWPVIPLRNERLCQWGVHTPIQDDDAYHLMRSREQQFKNLYPEKASIGSHSIPVMWDRPPTEGQTRHERNGQYVLYMDGHVEMHPLDPSETRFPLSPSSHAWLNSHIPAPSGDLSDPWGDCP